MEEVILINNVKMLREEQNISQAILAEAVATRRETIGRLERGLIQNPSYQLVYDIAEYFHQPIEKVFTYVKKSKYDKFRIIKEKVDAYDYYSLLESGAPSDEFDSYSRKFVDILSVDDSIEEMANKIANVMDPAFNETVQPKNFMELAGEIKEAFIKNSLE